MCVEFGLLPRLLGDGLDSSVDIFLTSDWKLTDLDFGLREYVLVSSSFFGSRGFFSFLGISKGGGQRLSLEESGESKVEFETEEWDNEEGDGGHT